MQKEKYNLWIVHEDGTRSTASYFDGAQAIAVLASSASKHAAIIFNDKVLVSKGYFALNKSRTLNN